MDCYLNIFIFSRTINNPSTDVNSKALSWGLHLFFPQEQILFKGDAQLSKGNFFHEMFVVIVWLFINSVNLLIQKSANKCRVPLRST